MMEVPIWVVSSALHAERACQVGRPGHLAKASSTL